MYRTYIRTLALACAFTPLLGFGMDGNSSNPNNSNSTYYYSSSSYESSEHDYVPQPNDDNFVVACCKSLKDNASDHPYMCATGTAFALIAGYIGYVTYTNWGNNWATVKKKAGTARKKTSELVNDVRARWNGSNKTA